MIAINQEQGRAANGMTSEFLAPSAYRVWTSCMELSTPWDSANQEAWDRVATSAIRIVDDNIAADASMSAQSFAMRLCEIAYQDPQKWDELSDRDRLVWNTVGRHIINCLDAEPGAVDPEKLEPLSVQWFKNQVTRYLL